MRPRRSSRRSTHSGHGIVADLTPAKAEALKTRLEQVGAVTRGREAQDTHNWPLPYDELTNPLAINLTAGNTFILICSSVTMVLALSAIQRGKRGQGDVLPGAPPSSSDRSS